MSDFEPISIEIEASAEKANRGLQELDSSLQNIQTRIQGISQLLNGLSGKGSSVASSIKSLANAINGINTNNVKNVSTAIDNIGTSAENSATKTKKSIEGIDENLNAISRAMRDAFKIKSTEGIDALSEAVRKLYEAKERAAFANTNGDQLGFEMATQEAERLREKIIEIAQEFGRYSSKGIEENKKLWDNIKSYAERGEKIYIDPELRGDILDDDFKALNSKLNNVFSKVEPPAWLSNPTFFKDWRDRMQTELSGIDLFKSPKGSGENPLKTIAEYAEEGKRANMSLGDAIKGNKKDIQELEEFANQAYETLGKLADTVANKFMSDSMEQYAESVREAQQGTSGLSTEVSKLGDSAPKIEKMASAYGKVGEELRSSLSEGINENAFANQMQNIQNVMTSGFTRTVQAIKSSLKEIKLPPIDTSNADKAGQEVKEKINSAVRSEKWSDVFSEIERMNQDYEQLTHTMGEANAEMQILVDTRNRLKQAFSATESGKMLWDTESMTKANAMLKDAEDKIERVKRSIKEPNRLELEVDPTGELEQLYSRLREVQSLISDMRNNKINFTTTDMTSALKEQETITKRIAELEGRSTKKDNNSLEWMAQIMALQNQLEKMSGTFNRWGEIAKKAFLKALTPLKLFKHEFEEIKGLITAVSRIGSAFAMISKPITKVFKNFQKTAQQAFSKIQKAWAKVMRTFTFMLIRKAITAVITNINNAITSLAKFSKTTDGKFNDTMSLLTSDFRYLGASLVAAFSPILNYVVPILDRFVDVLVGVINKVNMFFAVLTKSKTYTIAKKKIVDYTDAMEDANKKAKQLTLGIDELNILSEDTSSKKDEEDMFDWVTLPTPTIDIPDWLKWLKDLWSKLWDAIKQMLKALWDALKEAWNRAGEALKNAIKHFLESLVGLITDIIRDLTKLFQTEKFKEFLAKLLRIIAKIIEFISIIIDKIREAWNYNNLGYQILEAILDILDTIATHIENILDMMIEWAHSLTFVPLFEAVLAVLKQINYAIDQIGYVAEDVAKIVLGILKLVIEDYAPRLLRVIGDIIEGIGNIAKQLHEAIEETNFTDRFVSAFDGLMQAIIPHLEEVGEYFKLWASQLDFTPLLESIIKLFESLEPVADFVGGVFADFVEHYILPVAKHLVEKIIPEIADAIANFADAVNWDKLRQNVDKLIKVFEHLTASIGEGVAKAMDYLGQALAKFVNSDRFTAFIDYIAKFANKVDGDMIAKVLEAIGVAIIKLADAVMKFVMSDTVQNFLNGLIKFIKTSSVDKIANILLEIAKAFVAFKALSFLAKYSGVILNFITIIGKLATALSPTGALIVGIGAAIAAFALFGDTLAAIDWAGIAKTILTGLVELVNSIDWVKVGQNLSIVIGKIMLAALETVFNPAWILLASATVVKALIGMVAGIQTGFIETVATAFEQMGLDAIAGFIRGIGKAFAEIWEFIRKLYQGLIDFVKMILGIHSPSTVFEEIGKDVILGFWNGITELWNEFWTWISDTWNNFVLWCSEVWRNVVQAIVDAWNGFLETMQGVWQTISEWFMQIWEDFKVWVTETWSAIVQAIVDAWHGLIEKIQAVWDEIKLWFEETWNTFTEWVGEVWNNIVSIAANSWNVFIDFVSKIWEDVKKWFEDTWNEFKTWVKTTWESIVQTAIDTWHSFKDKIAEIWQDIKKWFEDTWSNFKQWCEDTWNNIIETIMNVWRGFIDRMSQVWDSIKGWFETTWNDFKQWCEDTWNAIIDAIIQIWNDFQKTIEEIWGKIVEFFKTLWDEVQGIWEKVWKSIVEAVQKIWNDFISSIEKIWNGIVTTLKDIWNGVQEAWETVWTNIGDFIKKTVNSILTFIDGMINGVVEGINTVIGAINNVGFHFEPPDWAQEMLGIGSIDFSFNIPKVPKVNIPRFATGGFPEDGWFRASHGEIMGQFDNGKSVVANNNQIVDGIASGVSQANSNVVDMLREVIRAIEDKDTTLNIDSREIAKANSKGQSKLGHSLVTFT